MCARLVCELRIKKMKLIHYIYSFAVALGLLLTGCSDELKAPNETSDDEATAMVAIRLSAAPVVTITTVSPEATSVNSISRVIDIDDPNVDGDNGLSTKICNLWIVQFDGTDDDAVKTGAPAYLTSSDFKEFDEIDNEGKRVVGVELNAFMVVAAKKKNTIVFLANTFDETKVFDTSLTLGQMKAMADIVSKEDDLFAFDNEGSTRHLQFNGLVQTYIAADGTTAVECDLKRNVARVDFTMLLNKNSGLTVNDASVGAALDHSYLLTNYDGISDNFPDVSDANVGISGFTYSVSADGTSIDKNSDDIYDIFTYRFYVPANQRGSVTNDLAPYKNTYAPHLATYLRIDGTFVESGSTVDKPVSITVFLGENFTNNFDLKPNYSYNMKLTMESLEEDAYDSRLQNLTIVDYSLADLDRANCYMLQPSESADYATRYIIPVDRINTFWGGFGYEDDPDMCIYNARPWVPLVIWADFDYGAAGVEISTTSGKTTTINAYDKNGKSTSYSAPLGYGTADKIQVDVPAGAEGNILVGVRRIDSNSAYLNMNNLGIQEDLSGFCWSWHLWITDYRPDDVETNQVHPVSGQYVYKVTGGSVHRYSGDGEYKGSNTEWNNHRGEFANAFFMDRNLGARSYLPPENDSEFGGPGYLYYQSCRKDPFWHVDRFVVWAPLLNIKNKKIFSNSGIPKSLWFNSADSYVNNPAEYTRTPVGLAKASGRLHGSCKSTCRDVSSWCVYDIDDGKKSILDPSPLGWQLPHTENAWTDFRPRSNARPTVSSKSTLYVAGETRENEVDRGFQKDSDEPMWYEYWPYPTQVGANDQVPEDKADKIIFPCAGRFEISSTGGFNNGYSYGKYAMWLYEIPGIYTIGPKQGCATDQEYNNGIKGSYCDRIVPIRCVRYMDYR